MNRALTLSLSIAFVTTIFAGCLGDDGGDLSGAIPRAKVTVAELTGQVDTFVFDASASTGRGLKFEWDFDDGTTANEPKVTHTFTYGPNIYDVTLEITDAAGIPDVWTGAVQVGNGINLPPEALFKPSTRYLEVGEPFTVDAGPTSDPEGDPIRYEWDFNYIMTEDEYISFRDAKLEAEYDDAFVAGAGPPVSNGDGGVGESEASLPSIDPDHVTGLLDGNKDPGHPGHNEAPPVSLFNGLRTSIEPEFTLEEGFPEATRFYVKLTAYDVKGATRDVLSEEIWPVLVVENKKPEFHADELTGTFVLGGPSTFTETTDAVENENTQETYDDDYLWEFDIEHPIVAMYINITWTQHPAADLDEVGPIVANSIDLDLTSPNDKTRKESGDGEEIRLYMEAADELGAGDWDVWLYGRNGADIQWTATYWAQVDLNPFRDLEAPYVPLERTEE